MVVVHAKTKDQVLQNIAIAEEAGADGVFLINHNFGSGLLISYYKMAKMQFPNFWIGLNCLDLGRSAIHYIPSGTAGLWVDNVGIEEHDEKPTAAAAKLLADRQKLGWQGLYFGSVAFKYQKKVDDVAKVAKLAVPFMDVITTSGAGTGIAADVDKIRTMKEAIGDHPLAIASGITPENVESYLPYSDCFLVATGISDSHTELNPGRVRRLAQILNK